MGTAATFPKAIFCVSAAMFTLSFTLFSCIRLRDPAAPTADVEEAALPAPAPVHPALEREDTLVDVSVPAGPKAVSP